jgi:hypothetical protein
MTGRGRGEKGGGKEGGREEGRGREEDGREALSDSTSGGIRCRRGSLREGEGRGGK